MERPAARRGWRYFATRLNGDGTETLLDPDVPLEGVTVEDMLSGHNGLSGTIEPVYARLKGSDGQPLFREWSTALYAENNGDIRGGGILTSSTFNGASWDLECGGFTSYAVDLPWTAGAPVTNDPPGWKIAAGKDGSGLGIRVDPIDMARVIWRQIQAQPGGNIGLDFAGTTTSGRVKIGTELQQGEFDTQSGPLSYESGPYKLNWYENHNLAGSFDELAAMTPFDYHEVHYWDAADRLRHHVHIGYPKLGRRREDLRFTYGVNVFDPVAISRDGTHYASGMMVLGAGEGNRMIKAIVEPPRRAGQPLRRVAVVVDDTLKTVAAAERRAERENQWRSRLDDVSSIMVTDHHQARLGAAGVGDEVRIEGQGDWIGVDMWVRILAIAYQPNDGQVAEYTIARTDKLP